MSSKLFPLALIVLLTACGSGDDPEDSDNMDNTDNERVIDTVDNTARLEELSAKVHLIDFKNAQGFFITGSSADGITQAQSTIIREDGAKAIWTEESTYSINSVDADDAVDLEPNSLYTINGDGTLERATVNDENGAEIPRATVVPVGIEDINAQYLFLWLAIAASEDDEENIIVSLVPYLVHKSTGLAYNASDLMVLLTQGRGYYSYIPSAEYELEFLQGIVQNLLNQYPLDVQWDDNGNLYVREGSVYKIDTSTLGSSSIEVVELPSIDIISIQWVVDKEGKFILYNVRDSSPTGNYARYLSIDNGSLYDLSAEMSGAFLPNWIIGLDQKIYTTSSDNKMYKIEADINGAPVITDKGYVSYTATNPANANRVADNFSHLGGGTMDLRHVVGGKLMVVNHSYYTYDVDTTNATVHFHSSIKDAFSSGIESHKVSGDYIYYFGRLETTNTVGIFRYNPVTFEGEVISADVNYDIREYEILGNGQFLIEGYRLSDQAYFYGELALDGSVTVTSTVAQGEAVILQMEAIHPTDFSLIDGNANDWPTDTRVLTDAAGDASQDGVDLLFYSEVVNGSNYFAMIEYDNGSDQAFDVDITLVSGFTLRMKSGEAKLLDSDLNELSSLSAAGGTFAMGRVIEYSIPLNQIGGVDATIGATSVEAYSEETFGSVESVSATFNTSDFDITLEMATPKGDAEIVVQLTDTHSLTIGSDNTASVSDGATIIDFRYPVTDGDDIELTISVGDETSLTPVVTSEPLIVTTQIDIMN